MKHAERKIPPLLPNTQHGRKGREREKKCLFSSSTSFSCRRCGQVTFMETLFLDCSLAGVHYSSAYRWNILCKMSAYVNENSVLIRMSCFVKSCCNLSLLLISDFPPHPTPRPPPLQQEWQISIVETSKTKTIWSHQLLWLIILFHRWYW